MAYYIDGYWSNKLWLWCFMTHYRGILMGRTMSKRISDIQIDIGRTMMMTDGGYWWWDYRDFLQIVPSRGWFGTSQWLGRLAVGPAQDVEEWWIAMDIASTRLKRNDSYHYSCYTRMDELLLSIILMNYMLNDLNVICIDLKTSQRLWACSKWWGSSND